MAVDKKRCTRCGKIKPHADFNKEACTATGFRADCRACRKAYRNRPDVKKQVAEYQAEYIQALRNELRCWILVILTNGRLECTLCDNTNYTSLDIDHIAEDGNKYRKNGAINILYYQKMLETGCVGLQCLCHGCNVRKSIQIK